MKGIRFKPLYMHQLRSKLLTIAGVWIRSIRATIIRLHHAPVMDGDEQT